MAFDIIDCYLVLSDGMFAGTTEEQDLVTPFTFTEKLTRILSHGLLNDAPSPIISVLLNAWTNLRTRLKE